MSMEKLRLYDVIDKEEPRGQSVSYQGIPCTARHCCTNLNRLTEENEQLRQTIKEVQELLTEEVDLFSDKATEHDIIAYKEMNEFDNKDAYYMCVSTKKAIKMLQRCLDE